MKKLLVVLAPLSLALTACVAPTGGAVTGTTEPSTANGLATMAVKVGIQSKCMMELNDNAYWATVSRVLTETQKQSYETEVCSCVAEKATSSVSAAEWVAAAMDKSSQADLASKVISQTLNTCVAEVFKQ